VPRSVDDIFDELVNDLRGILLHGFVARTDDGGQAFRLMKIDERRLVDKAAAAKEEILAKCRDEIAKAREQAKPANGNQPQPQRKP
jgi:hypothetical protein